jgi:hypothetical protein
MIDALIKHVFVTCKCYEMYVHRGEKVQLLVFSDRLRNGRHLISKLRISYDFDQKNYMFWKLVNSFKMMK